MRSFAYIFRPIYTYKDLGYIWNNHNKFTENTYNSLYTFKHKCENHRLVLEMAFT